MLSEWTGPERLGTAECPGTAARGSRTGSGRHTLVRRAALKDAVKRADISPEDSAERAGRVTGLSQRLEDY
jgi:hypothetical protein